MAGLLLRGRIQPHTTARAHPFGLSDSLAPSLRTSPVQVLSAGQKLPECQRLIVLVPHSEFAQDARLPQRIWQLALKNKVQVLYLAMTENYESEMSARRQLTLLAAVTRDKHVPVDIRIVHHTHWDAALRPIVQPGDLILSYSGQTVRKGWFGSEGLGDQLSRRLAVPVYYLPGYALNEAQKPSPILSLPVSIALLGLILAGFFALDAQVIYQTRGTLQQVMLFILICIEVGAVWVSNGLTG